MSLYGSSVEYGLHCLLNLVDEDRPRRVSSANLAHFQGISPTYVAKLLSQLKSAGLVRSIEGARGGYELARSPDRITVFDVICALEGDKRLFNCAEVRFNCALFKGSPPGWASKGVCSIHAVMIEAENEMRKILKDRTLADISKRFEAKAPKSYLVDMDAWLNCSREFGASAHNVSGRLKLASKN